MADTSGLWRTGYSLLAASVVLDSVRKTQKEFIKDKDTPKVNLPKYKRKGYGIY